MESESLEGNTTMTRIMTDLDNFLAKSTGGSLSTASKRPLQAPFEDIARRLDYEPDEESSAKRKRTESRLELMEAKCKIARLESQVMNLENDKKRTQLQIKQASDSHVQQLIKKEEEIVEIRDQLKFISEKEEIAVENLEETEKEKKHINSKLDNQILELKQQNRELNSQVRKYGQIYGSKVLKLQQEIARLSQEKLDAEENAMQGVMLSDLKARQSAEIAAMREENADLTDKVMGLELENKDLQVKLAQYGDASDIMKIMQHDLPRLKHLEAQNITLKQENASLRENRANSLLLKEQLSSLQIKFDKAKESMNLMRKLEIENEGLKSKISKWEAEDINGEDRRPRSPAELSAMICELQKQQLVMIKEKTDLQNGLTRKDALLAALSDRFKSQKEELQEIKRREKPQGEQIRALQRKLLHATTERDGIRRILASYDQQDSTDCTPQLTIRVKEAEELVCSTNEKIKKLENDLEAVQNERSSLFVENEKFQEEVKLHEEKARSRDNPELATISSEELSRLQAENTALKEKLEVMEIRFEEQHLRGDFDPTKTKVLHFGKNPLAITKAVRLQEMERLREENESLHRKVRRLQEGLDASVLQSEASPAVVKELESQIQSVQLKMKRMKEAFSNTADQFREACYRLFGYSIELSNSDRYKVLSFFAESEKDYLIFRLAPNGEMQVIETDYSLRCMPQIEAHLGLSSWIPSFLASLTIELANKQTVIEESTTEMSSALT